MFSRAPESCGPGCEAGVALGFCRQRRGIASEPHSGNAWSAFVSRTRTYAGSGDTLHHGLHRRAGKWASKTVQALAMALLGLSPEDRAGLAAMLLGQEAT